MEATISYLEFRVQVNNGKENGDYYRVWGLGFRIVGTSDKH